MDALTAYDSSSSSDKDNHNSSSGNIGIPTKSYFQQPAEKPLQLESQSTVMKDNGQKISKRPRLAAAAGDDDSATKISASPKIIESETLIGTSRDYLSEKQAAFQPIRSISSHSLQKLQSSSQTMIPYAETLRRGQEFHNPNFFSDEAFGIEEPLASNAHREALDDWEYDIVLLEERARIASMK